MMNKKIKFVIVTTLVSWFILAPMCIFSFMVGDQWMSESTIGVNDYTYIDLLIQFFSLIFTVIGLFGTMASFFSPLLSWLFYKEPKKKSEKDSPYREGNRFKIPERKVWD